MKAYRMTAWDCPPEFVDVPVPKPGPDELLLRMDAVGLCHSDILIQDSPAGLWNFDPPFTLGHENAGTVVGRGVGAGPFIEGQKVLASSVHACGYCRQCVKGRANYCEVWAGRSITRGVGIDGGLAEYMVVPAREVVPYERLTPARASVLSDAGVTSYRAVKDTLGHLDPESTVVVIGPGGLGGYAVQYLKIFTAARVVVVDRDAKRLAYAASLGADATVLTALGDPSEIEDVVGKASADAVLDFVGTDETLALALWLGAPMGRITVCGAAGGTVPVGWRTIAGGCHIVVSHGSTMGDLHDVVALGEQGLLQIETDVHEFEDIAGAYERLRTGAVRSRLVIEVNVA